MQKLFPLFCLVLCMHVQAQDTLVKETHYDPKTKTGTVTQKLPGGKLVEEYLNGKLHGKRTYSDSAGRTMHEYHYKNGLKDGAFTEINHYPGGKNYPAGETKSTGSYKEGKEHGQFKKYLNGKLQNEYYMENGSATGAYTVYDPVTGKVVTKGVYHGQNTSTTVFKPEETCKSYHTFYGISWERCYNLKNELIRESLYDTITKDYAEMVDHRLLQVTYWTNKKKIKQEKYHYDYKVVSTWNEKGVLLNKDTIAINTDPMAPPAPTEPYSIVDEPATFAGTATALQEYLLANMVYPAEAKEQNIQGRVFVQFIVNRDGSIANVSLVKGTNPLLDKEALRLVKNMPAWTPGKLKGKVVATRVTIPVRFVLP